MTLAIEERTVADLVAEAPLRANVFEKRKIDYCCHGRRTLAEVCAESGIPVAELAAELDAQPAAPSTVDWRQAPLADLASFIVDRHHRYLREALLSAGGKIEKVVAAHGAKHAFLSPLRAVFGGMTAELNAHMSKEEIVLFPYIARLERAAAGAEPPPQAPGGTVRNPIRMMEIEHDEAGAALRRMRELTSDYTLPEGACNTFRALYAQLEEIEGDLHRHIHLENNILFPRAAALEDRLRS